MNHKKNSQLQKIFFAVADPSCEIACADLAKGQIKLEVKKLLDALTKDTALPTKGTPSPNRVSLELLLKVLDIYLDEDDPFKNPKPFHRMKKSVNYSHLIRVLCFKNTQAMVGKMMTKHQGRTTGLSEKAIRDRRDKSEASLKVPPELEDRLYQVAFAVYYRLASTHRISPYLRSKK